MKLQPVSSYVMSNSLRSVISTAQANLLKAREEATTGLIADKGLTLGGRTGQTISLRKEYDRLTSLTDTNKLVSQRMTASQLAMEKLVDNGQAFLANLMGLRDSTEGAAVLAENAKSSMQTALDLMNTSFGGEYLFAGVNTDVKPMDDYTATGASSRAAVLQAFEDHFGFPTTDPQVASITKDEMAAFIDGALADEFNDANWDANWSDASSNVVKSRIAPTELTETSVSANGAAFRKMAMAYSMIAEFADIGLSKNAFTALADKATEVTANAISGFSHQQSVLGNSQARTANASARLTTQIKILNNSVLDLEAVDPYEAQVRVTDLIKQIETSYALTVKIQNLSILNYLR